MKNAPKPRQGEPRRSPSFPVEALPTRRGFLSIAGSSAVVLAISAPAAFSARSLVPNALYEKPLKFKAGPLDRFPDGSTFLPEQRVFIFRAKAELHCMSAICTHLGCTVQYARLAAPDKGADFEFRCPCHGSKYHADGTNYEGPAPDPLAAYALELAPDDGQLIVDMGREMNRSWRLRV